MGNTCNLEFLVGEENIPKSLGLPLPSTAIWFPASEDSSTGYAWLLNSSMVEYEKEKTSIFEFAQPPNAWKPQGALSTWKLERSPKINCNSSGSQVDPGNQQGHGKVYSGTLNLRKAILPCHM
jgi:hypothetical protein